MKEYDNVTDKDLNKMIDDFGAVDEDDLVNKLIEESFSIPCLHCGHICKQIITYNGNPYCSVKCINQFRGL